MKDIKKIWQGVKSIVSTKSSKAYSPSINIDGTISSDPVSIANTFNDYFSSIANQIRNKNVYFAKSFTEFLPQANEKSLFILPTDTFEVMARISLLKESKCEGPFSIPTKILLLLKHVISEVISQLVNLS